MYSVYSEKEWTHIKKVYKQNLITCIFINICIFFILNWRYLFLLFGADIALTRCRFLPALDLAYAAADLVVSRAGAMTCSEILATGKPCILVLNYLYFSCVYYLEALCLILAVFKFGNTNIFILVIHLVARRWRNEKSICKDFFWSTIWI